MKHARYLWYVVRHKWFVTLECLRHGLLWRGVRHDLSKFLPSEWLAYVNYFYGDREPPKTAKGYNVADDPKRDRAFDEAWLRHIHRNDHHWQFWLLRKDSGESVALPMPRAAWLEMLCDWRGAGQAQGAGTDWTQTRQWYTENKVRIILHSDTRADVECHLALVAK